MLKYDIRKISVVAKNKRESKEKGRRNLKIKAKYQCEKKQIPKRVYRIRA